MTTVLSTPRLVLRHFVADDASFVLELLTDPGWIRYIGDRGVRNEADARAYIARGAAAIERQGFGLYLVARKDDGAPLGMAGLVDRDGIDGIDIGFAFLARHRGQGYAREAARAILDHARALGHARVLAITSQDNAASIRLLEELGFAYQGDVALPPSEERVRLYATTSPTPRAAT